MFPIKLKLYGKRRGARGILGLVELSRDSRSYTIKLRRVLAMCGVVTRSLYRVYVLKTLHCWRRGTRSNDHDLVDKRESKFAPKMPTFRKLDEYSETED